MQLRVWWCPQIPCKAFHWPVTSLVEGRMLLDALAQYDLFQLEHNIKPDFCNAGGLQVFDPEDDHDGPNGSWSDWYDDDGRSIDDFTLDELRAMQAEAVRAVTAN